MSVDEKNRLYQLKLSSAPPRWIFFAIFTISGFSGLVYESIWSHYLKLFLGHAAYAQSLVLMIFMGGLAFGSWLTAKFSERFRTPILVYALIEAVIGIIALLFHELFVSISDAFYFSLLPSLGIPVLAGFLKWGAASALIVPQSVLLGMTFPLMTTGIVRRYADHPGGSLAMLYFTNSIGAAIGVLVSGFWLIGLVGLPGTIMTAGSLNIMLALIVAVLVKLDPEPEAAPVKSSAEPARAAGSDGLTTLIFVAAGITGAASFIYEIGWLRMLSLVLGATTHSFELMLSAFIAGLAFGGLWIKRRIDGIGDPVRFAGWVQVLMGTVAVLTVPLYVQTFDWMAALLQGLQRSDAGYTLFTAAGHGIALAVMVPTTFLAGMTLPLFTHVLMRGPQGERAIGRVYAANTCGAIAGVLFAVHVGLPLLGLKMLIGLGATLDVALGVVLLQRSRRAETAPILSPALSGALIGALALAFVVGTVDLDPRRLVSGVYRYSSAELEDGATVLYYKDGKTASIALAVIDGLLSISTNGKPDAAIQIDPNGEPAADEATMMMLAAVPLAYRPGASRVANIGFGSGLTTHTLLGDKDIESVDTVEIESAVIEAATGFGERVERAYADPRSRIHIEDAKTFFSLQNRRYDVIVAEPSNPWVSGVASLFSEDFYRTVHNYLEADGILVQWLQLYEFNDRLALSVLGALHRHFSDYAIYNTGDVDVVIVATGNGSLPEPTFERVLSGTLGAELARVGLHSADDFSARKTGTRELIAGLLSEAAVPVNSDYFPYLDLNAGRARFRAEFAGLFYGWSVASLPLLEMLGVSAPDFSNVTVAASFSRTDNIAHARRIRHMLVEPKDLDGEDVRSLPPALITLRLLAKDCADGGHEEEWLQGLHALAELAVPYLNAAEALDLLRAVLPPNCRVRRSERVLAWLDLYEAVADRNPQRIVDAADHVFDIDPRSDARRYRYAASAAVLAQLAAGRPEQALALWQNRLGTLGEAGMSAELRLLRDTARARAAQ